MVKPLIYCLEDFEMHRFMLENNINALLSNRAVVRYFRGMQQFNKCTEPCHLLISDLTLGDSPAYKTAEFLMQYCQHTPVFVQSTHPDLPDQLEELSQNKIIATEKAGHGPRFRAEMLKFMARFESQVKSYPW